MIDTNNLYMIVPVWFSDALPEADILDMLEETIDASDRFASPEHHFFYLDGIPKIAPTIERYIHERMIDAQVDIQTENRGKGAGVRTGLKRGLEHSQASWFMVRDADGDHRADEAGGLLQLAEQMQSECGDVPIVIAGRRVRLEPPLTLYRAVYELVLNRCIDAALRYALAKKNHIPSSVYYRAYGDVPDLQSGYKLYNRPAAEIVVKAFADLADGEFDALRLGAEIVPYVSVVMQGGIVGERMRSTYREQPASAYASVKRAEFYAKKLAWVFRTCEVSMWNAVRLLDGELAFCPLIFDGMGRVELLKFRELVLTALRKRSADEIPAFQTGSKMI